jgi:ABC-type branched-chain amino acid transport systems, ATPase component
VSSAATTLEVSGLTKRFGGLVAVKDLSFALRGGEILGLIGPNGSGKSTAMKSILGVELPSEGSVKLDGIELAGMPAYRVARQGVGLVFQHSRPLNRQSVLENIKIALLPDRLTQLVAGAHVDAQARSIAERVGLRRGARSQAADAALRRPAATRAGESDRPPSQARDDR